MKIEGNEIYRLKLAWALPVFILLVIAVVSWQWIDDRNVVTQADEPINMAVSQSDYYLENFEIINISNTTGVTTGAGDTNDNESLKSRRLKLTGKSLSHNHVKGISTLDHPVVVMRSENDDYWLASARSGNVSAEFDVLDLNGNVELTNHGPMNADNSDSIRIDTESLTIDTSQQIVETNEVVQVTGRGWNYNANSMNAEINNGRLSFQSGVEATFVSPN